MERFTQKLGPLPVWAWAAIGVLALVGYMYFTKTGFFGSGSAAGAGDAGAPTGSSGPLGSLLGNLGLTPNPAAYASVGLGGGGGGIPTANPAAASPTFGPAITTYDNSAGTDRGGSTTPPPPGPPAQPLTVQLFAPIASQLGRLLPGVLTPAPPPAPVATPWQPAAAAAGFTGRLSSTPTASSISTPTTPASTQGQRGHPNSGALA